MSLAKVLVSLAGLGALVYGQELLWTRLGVPNVEGLGQWMQVVGDLDGDGWSDLVTPGPAVGPLGYGYSGLFFLSGRDGIVQGIGEHPGDYLGYSVAGCGDIDGDGFQDFAAGNSDFLTPRGVVRVFSGQTGTPLYTWTARNSRPGGRLRDRALGRCRRGSRRHP